ncbi:transmembrane protein 53-like [Dreissena polymorpha]|uniref:Uncharacterized protein n=1 Tax=Dreissena polymorpha TaxID=45954 RepID=A0A9D4RW95_DREPO|nr:transmembrane protein 53-like [Dreissena polymorpha]KAH3883741.1 hypothetical protein DPMN_007708 [Dreissena polymorpha]
MVSIRSIIGHHAQTKDLLIKGLRHFSSTTTYLTNKHTHLDPNLHQQPHQGHRRSHRPTHPGQHSTSGSAGRIHVSVNKNVTLAHHVHHGDDQVGGPRPLLLLLGWLFAKPSHLKKFSDFYTEHGFDVMTVRVTLSQLLRPKTVQSLMQHVLDLCYEGQRREQPLLCHALSVGGYMYGELLTSLNHFSERYQDFDKRLFGKIFDSPVDFYGIPNGVARAMTGDPKRVQRIEKMLEWYMEKFRPVTKQYINSSENVHRNELKTPALFLYSQNDPVVNPVHIEALAHTWRGRGIRAATACWERAPHVTSFKMYPEEYKSHLINFIWGTGLPGHRLPKSETAYASVESDNNKEQLVMQMAYA